MSTIIKADIQRLREILFAEPYVEEIKEDVSKDEENISMKYTKISIDLLLIRSSNISNEIIDKEIESLVDSLKKYVEKALIKIGKPYGLPYPVVEHSVEDHSAYFTINFFSDFALEEFEKQKLIESLYVHIVVTKRYSGNKKFKLLPLIKDSDVNFSIRTFDINGITDIATESFGELITRADIIADKLRGHFKNFLYKNVKLGNFNFFWGILYDSEEKKLVLRFYLIEAFFLSRMVIEELKEGMAIFYKELSEKISEVFVDNLVGFLYTGYKEGEAVDYKNYFTDINLSIIFATSDDLISPFGINLLEIKETKKALEKEYGYFDNLD